MKDYSIPSYPMRRLRYYNNQFLNEKDFIDDQASHIARMRAPLRALCVAGVCEGLTVRLDAGGTLQVAPGVAIDRDGNVIAFDAEKPGPDAQNLADGLYLLHITFAEEQSDPANPPEGGAPGMTRWLQAPMLGATRSGTAVPATAVVLGSFQVAQGVATAAGTTGRQWSGVRLPGTTAAAPTLANDGDDAGDGAVFTGDLTMRRDAGAGKLGPTLALINGAAFPGGAGSGAAIDFGAYDPAGYLPSLRVQSHGDNAGSSHLVISTKGSGPGGIGNPLVERLRVTSLGTLQFPDGSQDKIVLANAYGIGINGNHLSLYYPPSGRLSLSQNGMSGTEVFGVSGAGDVSAIGTVSWGDAGTRTESRDDAGLQTTAGARSGFYQAPAPVNFPSGAAGWWHLIDVRHTSTANNYALQIAGSFFDQSLWYRKTNNSPTTAWRQFVTADANGDATLAGKLNLSGYPPTSAAASINAPTMEIGGDNPVPDGSGGGVLYLHHHRQRAHQLRYNDGTLYFESTPKYGGTHSTPSLNVGGGATFGGAVSLNDLDAGSTRTAWNGWLEAIRFTRPEHSAITHPGGKLLFGLHSNRHFVFADTNAGRDLLTISGETGNVNIGVGRLDVAGGAGFGGGVSVKDLDVNAISTTWGNWYEAIRLSRPENAAITHPGGKLLFGLDSNRNFYFCDTAGERAVMKISAATGDVNIPAGRLDVAEGAGFGGDVQLGGALRADGGIHLNGALALNRRGDWLCLNDTRAFTLGTSINGGLWVERALRVDGLITANEGLTIPLGKTLSASTIVASEATLGQEEWRPVGLAAGWTVVADFATPGYFKDSCGVVHLRGVIAPGPPYYNDIFGLPAEYHPSNAVSLSAMTSGGPRRLRIEPNGRVFVIGLQGVGDFLSLDGISFRAT